jgi:hypothetical protein
MWKKDKARARSGSPATGQSPWRPFAAAAQ